jgi:ribosomal-protein-alanine N-acetyltransferase
MLKTLIVTGLTDSVFTDATLLWQLSGVGNPARGDDFRAVAKTLANGGRLVMLYNTGDTPSAGAPNEATLPVRETSAGDEPVGTVWLTHDFRRMYIHHMAVHPHHQNKGCGKILMQEALKYAGELKLQAKLEVHSQNLPANKLYSHYGFEILDGYRLMIKRDV